MNIKNVPIPQQEVETKTRSIVVAAQSLAIFNDDSYRQATAQLIGIKQVRQMIHEIHDPAVAAAFTAHKEACKAKRTVEAPLIEAEAIIKRKMALYCYEQDRKREEQEDNLPVVLPAAIPKVEGISYKETYHAEVFDIRALARAVADGQAAPELILPNMQLLNTLARALKSAINVPGVRAVASVVVAAKAEP